MVALELEVLSKKFDRFGWDRDMGSAVHDRLVTDWIDALQDYPLGEVQEACREWVRENPRRMPNEGDILALVLSARRRAVARRVMDEPPEREVQRISKEVASTIMEAAGFGARRMPKTGEGE